ncbi:NAD(P)-dependent oxidoreductase [Caballeronia sp. 15711]|uniref:NAD(P)-dependent oxidoreductase n=1 Tax=Caballeronia sp. 15711 TaxID=3391029 RepID=UPI0039E652FA
MKAILHYRASPGFREQIRRNAPSWLDVVVVDEDDIATLSRNLRDADVLLHVLEPVTAEMLCLAPQLKLIQKIGVGVNTIDLDACKARAIAVANMPGTNSQAVAELALALLFATLRRIPLLDRAVRNGQGWSLGRETFDASGEVAGKTVGLVGYGEVPRRLSPVLKALGAQVIYSDLNKSDASDGWRTLSELLAESDIVSLHVPLTNETEHLIDSETIAKMKDGAVLINTARGGLVDERALASALKSGKLRAAGLDVLETEPANKASPLLALENIVTTPHIAWLTKETIERSLSVAFENCGRVREGENLLHRVA